MSKAVDRLKEQAFSAYLQWRTRPGPIRHAVTEALAVTSPRAKTYDRRRVRAAAVQMELSLIGDPTAYARKVAGLAGRAAADGADLICFPEDAATHLVGMLPGIEKLAAAGSVDAALGEMGMDVKVADIFRFLGSAMRRTYLATFSTVARTLGVYIAGGSVVLPEPDGEVRNRQFLFGPDGQVVASEAKTHLLPMEAEWGLVPGDQVVVYDTPFGRLGLPVCMDATYFEPYRLLTLMGAEIIINPSADPDEYNFWRKLRGVWPRVQESPAYGVNPCMVGNFMGMKLTGKSAIFAPLDLTPSGDGVLAQVEDPDHEGMAIATLDLEALAEYRKRYPVEAGFNLALYDRYFPAVYDRPERGGHQ